MAHILVIAQDAELAGVLVDVLSHAGFACAHAEDEAGVQAALLAAGRIDGAVIDASGQRSRELVAPARAHLAARGVPVVLALWAFDPPEPADEIVRRPYGPAELVDAVRRAARGPPAR